MTDDELTREQTLTLCFDSITHSFSDLEESMSDTTRMFPELSNTSHYQQALDRIASARAHIQTLEALVVASEPGAPLDEL